MGLFDSVWNFVGGSKSSSQGATDQTEKSTTKQDTQQKQTQSSTSLTSLLDPKTLALLTNIAPGLAAGIGSPQASPDVSTLRDITTRLMGNASTDIQPTIDAAIGAARRNFGLGEGAQISQLQQQIGSKGNGFSQLIEGQGNADLSTQLATVVSTILQSNRAQSDTELTGAAGIAGNAGTLDIASKQGPVANFLSVIDALKGSQVTQQSDILSSLSQLVNSETDSTLHQTTMGKTKDSPGLLQTLKTLGGG